MLIHVVTVKGKGHKLAEADAVRFHGVAPRAEGKVAPTYSEVFARTTLRLFREEPHLVAITAAMLEGTGLSTVAKEFSRRVFDVGISEQHAVTLAAGLASQGFIPIVAIYSTFLQRAYDQIIHDVCLQNLPVVFAIDRAGLVGDDGKTHQGSFDLSYLGCIPNLVLAAPADENELQHLLYTAVRSRCPFAIRYPRGQGLGVPLEEALRELPLGRGELRRQGDALAIMALGNTVAQAEAASLVLAAEGIGCAVVNARFARPLDQDLILSQALRTGRVLTVEENVQAGGFGHAVAGLLRQAGALDVRIVSLSLPDQFIEHGPQELFRARYSLDAQGIARRALSAFPELRARALTQP